MKSCLKLLMAIFFVFVFTGLPAQMTFGPKAGINLSTMTLESSGISMDPRMLMGFHIGMISEIQLTGNLVLQPGVLYSSKGSRYEITFQQTVFKYTLAPNYIEIPLNAAYSFEPGRVKFSFFAGPYFAFGIGGTRKSGSNTTNINFGSGENDDMKSSDIGINTGAGVEINGMTISAQYGFSLTDLSSSADYDTEMKNRVIGLSISYLFGNSDKKPHYRRLKRS
jgi:hypothetical protein